MLQDIRNSTQGPVFKVIVGLIVLSFALFGIESILLGGSDDAVAEVNGDKIRSIEVQQAVIRQKQRLAQLLGDNFDPAMFDDQQLSSQALQGLVSNKLQQQWAERLGLAVSDVQLGAEVAAIPAFQIEGRFSPELYKQSLASAGFTPASFKEALRVDGIVAQLNAGLFNTEFTSPLEQETAVRVAAENRSVRYANLPVKTVDSDIQVTEEEIEAYYFANSSGFISEERVVLDYIALSSEDYRQPVAEDDLRAAYEQEISSYAYQDESRVSHILLIQGEDEADDVYASRVIAAQEALASGEPFADAATRLSDDVGSSSAGGDLGYTSGDLFPEEMEEAIAGLDVGEVSGLVETDAGTHIITVTDRRSEAPPTLEEMRFELEQALSVSEARRRLVGKVEALKDLAFTATDLQGPAQELELVVQQTGSITRRGGDGIFSNDSVIEAAFSEAVLDEGYNSQVLEIDEDEFVVLRVAKHEASRPLTLAEVRTDIEGVLEEEARRTALINLADSLIQSLNSGESMEQIAKSKGLDWQVAIDTRRSSSDIPRTWRKDVFSAPISDLPFRSYAVLASGDAVVFEVFRVKDADANTPSDSITEASNSRKLALTQNALRQSVSEQLRDSADLTIYQ